MTQTLKFKTNIVCSGCVSQAKPALDATHGVERWEVDISSEHKILTVEGEDLKENEITEAVGKAGFKIEPQHN